MAKHYHVTAGLRGGYLPNTVEVYSTKTAALDAAVGRANEYRESGEKVHGNRARGYWVAREGTFPGEFYDYIAVDLCEVEACEAEDWD